MQMASKLQVTMLKAPRAALVVQLQHVLLPDIRSRPGRLIQLSSGMKVDAKTDKTASRTFKAIRSNECGVLSTPSEIFVEERSVERNT